MTCLPGIIPPTVSAMHGSVLGPLLFIMYTTPLSALISRRAGFDVSTLLITAHSAIITPRQGRPLFTDSRFTTVANCELAANCCLLSNIHCKFTKEAFVFVHYTNDISVLCRFTVSSVTSSV